MGPSFAETTTRRRSFAGLIGLATATLIAVVALHPCPPARRHSPARYDKFEHYRPVKKCIDGRWVIANQPDAVDVTY